MSGGQKPGICQPDMRSCESRIYRKKGSDTGNEDTIGGNVSKYVVLPNGYSGQPKKGHLTFDACFESAGLASSDWKPLSLHPNGSQ
ncbi:hypothetical protein STEG23_029757, partial [Scotinomys teguina]